MKKSLGYSNELQGDAMETATRTDYCSVIKGLVMLREREEKSPKQESQFQPEPRIKNVFKVMPWEQALSAAREIKTSR